ncbi:MAG: methyltransferase domain-containing protein [Gemmatimonadaceae bacterium]
MTETRNGTRACPVCGGSARTSLFRQQFAEVEAVTIVKGYDVVVCRECGAGFADDIPDQSAFDRYYRELSKYEYHQRDGAESDFDRRRLAIIADIVAPFISRPDARILDVGCATGRLLALLRDKGFPNVHGLDPSPSCAAAAGRLYDIPVRTTTLSHLHESGESFDVVILVGVLEHINDLDTALREVHDVLSPQGIVYAEVPDALTFADWPNAPFQDFSTEHINFFSPVSLGNLMARHGFATLFSEQNAREQSYRTTMSNVSAVFQKQAGTPKALTFDEGTENGLRRYVGSCQAVEQRLNQRIADLAESARAVVVWGVGTHTGRLMQTSRLHEANIVAFVESNVRYQGRTLHGVPIIAPDALRGRPEPILISSRVFQHEIAQQIREELGLHNEIITLYEF